MLAAPPPPPPTPPFNGTVQVFVSLRNLSANTGRKLLQGPTDNIQFGVLLVPVVAGDSLYDLPPTNASALYYYGVAADGNVSIYANGQLLTIIPCSAGQGSSTLALSRTPRFFTAAYAGAGNFPSTNQTGPGSATVVNPDGTVQVASANQSPPSPPPTTTTVRLALRLWLQCH